MEDIIFIDTEDLISAEEAYNASSSNTDIVSAIEYCDNCIRDAISRGDMHYRIDLTKEITDKYPGLDHYTVIADILRGKGFKVVCNNTDFMFGPMLEPYKSEPTVKIEISWYKNNNPKVICPYANHFDPKSALSCIGEAGNLFNGMYNH